MSIIRFTLFALVFALLTSPSLAQAAWTAQTSGVTDTLYAVSFVDRNEGWVVGGPLSNDRAVILHTLDGGKTWTPQASPVAKRLLNVKFLDHLNGWITGQDNTILHTADGGKSWQTQPAEGSLFYTLLRGLFMLDPTHGWASTDDAGVYRTTDGKTWNWVDASVCLGCAVSSLPGIHFTDALNGWVVGWYGYMRKTVDGGKTWQVMPMPDNDNTKNYYGVQFLSLTEGFVVGNAGRIYHTVDTGASWQRQTSNLTTILYAIQMLDTKTGWIVGDKGVILATADGGQHWDKQASGTTTFLQNLCMVSANEGWAVGGNGTILHYAASIPGDLDGNGTLTISDVSTALRLAAGLDPSTTAQADSATAASVPVPFSIASAVTLARQIGS